MKRILVIPAAGRGVRLGWDGPKALYPVAGRPMLDHLFARYAPLVDHIVIVVAPAAVTAFERHVERAVVRAECVVQPEPTGMLPAILCAMPAIEVNQPGQVWITWCDQIAISARTVLQLAEEIDRHPQAALVFPTVRQQPPYIHFVRDEAGRIVRVLQRREGDEMPAVGESDAGLFAIRYEAYLTDMPEYSRVAPLGAVSGERNFLPFIPWLANRTQVQSFVLPDAQEAVGVNTGDDVRALEAYFRGRV